MAEEEIDYDDDLQDGDYDDDDDVVGYDSGDQSDGEYDEEDVIQNDEDIKQNTSYIHPETKFEPIELTVESRKTPNYLSKYELARVLGIRADKIQRGYPIALKIPTPRGAAFDPIKLAALELINNASPLLIRRHLPSGRVEVIKVSDIRLFPGQKANLLSIINRNINRRI